MVDALDELFAWAGVLQEPFADETQDLAGRVEELRPRWMQDASCRGFPTDWWFPTRGESTGPAKRICARCSVRVECGAYAAAAPFPLAGVWGGKSGRDRR